MTLPKLTLKCINQQQPQKKKNYSKIFLEKFFNNTFLKQLQQWTCGILQRSELLHRMNKTFAIQSAII